MRPTDPPAQHGGELIGRDEELRALTSALDATAMEGGRLVLIGGEAGIGKTRLVDHFATHVREREVRVLWGRCFEGQGAPAFWAWLEVLRAGARLLAGDATTPSLGADADELTQLITETGWSGTGMNVTSDAADARFRMFDSVARLLGRVAREGPLLIVLEDLHAADQASLALLEFVVRRLREIPALIVSTYRMVGEVTPPPLAAAIVELGRESSTLGLFLQGLREKEIAALLARSGLSSPPELATVLYDRTEGNPLLVGEIMAMLVAAARGGGAMVVPEATVLGSVQAAMTRRLAPLSAECRDVLRIAALVGTNFHLDVVQSVRVSEPGTSRHGAGRSDESISLGEAMSAGIVIRQPSTRPQFRFTHPLLRDVLYAELGPQRAAALHGVVARVLEQMPDSEDRVAELALHFAEAADAAQRIDYVDGVVLPSQDNRCQAATYARKAGDQAMRMLAFEEGVRWYQRASDLLTYPGASAAERCAVLVDIGIAQRESGDLETSKATLLRAAEQAQRLQLPALLARAALHFGTRVVWGEPYACDPALVSLLEAAATAFGDQETSAHAHILARLALALVFSSDHERRLFSSRRALEMARRVDDSAAISEAIHAWLATHWRPDNIEERLALSAELVARAGPLQDRHYLALAYIWQAKLFAEAGDWSAARAAQNRFEQTSRRGRDSLHHWWVTLAQAARAIDEGRFADAESSAQEALLLEQRLNPGPPVGHLSQMVALWTVQGRRPVLEALLASQAHASGMTPGVMQQCVVANVARELGRRDEAQVTFDSLARRGFADFPQDSTWLACMHFAAEVAAYLEDHERAERLIDLLAPFETRAAVNPAGGVFLAPVAYDLAILETVLERWSDAERHFDQALAMSRACGGRPAIARTLFEDARMRRRRGDPNDADRIRRARAEARDLAGELGLALLSERIEAATEEPRGVNAPAPNPDTERPTAANTFRRDAEYWSIAYRGRVIHLKDSRGLQYLRDLLAQPDQECLALDLVAGRRPGDTGTPEAIQAQSLPGLDSQSKAAYRRRLDELRESKREAEEMNDPCRAERAGAEIQFIEEELSAALGLGGRDRNRGSNAERARSAVTKGIKGAIARISAAHPALGRHLDRTIRTGLFCVYSPDPDDRPTWQL